MALALDMAMAGPFPKPQCFPQSCLYSGLGCVLAWALTPSRFAKQPLVRTTLGVVPHSLEFYRWGVTLALPLAAASP